MSNALQLEGALPDTISNVQQIVSDPVVSTIISHWEGSFRDTWGSTMGTIKADPFAAAVWVGDKTVSLVFKGNDRANRIFRETSSATGELVAIASGTITGPVGWAAFGVRITTKLWSGIGKWLEAERERDKFRSKYNSAVWGIAAQVVPSSMHGYAEKRRRVVQRMHEAIPYIAHTVWGVPPCESTWAWDCVEWKECPRGSDGEGCFLDTQRRTVMFGYQNANGFPLANFPFVGVPEGNVTTGQIKDRAVEECFRFPNGPAGVKGIATYLEIHYRVAEEIRKQLDKVEPLGGLSVLDRRRQSLGALLTIHLGYRGNPLRGLEGVFNVRLNERALRSINFESVQMLVAATDAGMFVPKAEFTLATAMAAPPATEGNDNSGNKSGSLTPLVVGAVAAGLALKNLM
jgi:hypothetical protein